MRKLAVAVVFAATVLAAGNGSAQTYPAPKDGEWIARDFRFHTGEVMP